MVGNKITYAHFRDARIPALGLSALLQLVKYVPVLQHECLLFVAILLNVCLYCSKTCDWRNVVEVTEPLWKKKQNLSNSIMFNSAIKYSEMQVLVL